MLVTSRETKRWVLPKGWAEAGLAPHELAAKEAFEEAGLVGKVEREPVGTYRYEKRLHGGRTVPCEVGVYPLWVERQLDDWPERGQRKTQWFTLAQAALAGLPQSWGSAAAGLLYRRHRRSWFRPRPTLSACRWPLPVSVHRRVTPNFAAVPISWV